MFFSLLFAFFGINYIIYFIKKFKFSFLITIIASIILSKIIWYWHTEKSYLLYPLIGIVIIWALILTCSFYLLSIIFGFGHVSHFVNKYKALITSFLGAFIVITTTFFSFPFRSFLRRFLGIIWYGSFKVITRAVYLLLSLFFDGAFYKDTIVGIPSVSVVIFLGCSGIEGLSIFFILFSILVGIEYKNLNKHKVLFLYPIGLVGAYILNILRIFSIIVVGHFTSLEFAVGVFHSNIGWILFTAYFLLFVFLTYSWMKKK